MVNIEKLIDELLNNICDNQNVQELWLKKKFDDMSICNGCNLEELLNNFLEDKLVIIMNISSNINNNIPVSLG